MKKQIVYLSLATLLLAGCKETGTTTKAGEITIIYTNDVHCAYDGEIGYAGVAQYKKDIEKENKYVTLVDCGDFVQGEFEGLVSEGEASVELMNEVGYDLAILGNHEFDYGVENLEKLIEQSNTKYLACNIKYTGQGKSAVAELPAYELIEYGDVTVAYIGVSTPETITKSSPDSFEDSTGNIVYDFCGGEDGKELFNCVQKNVDECRDKGADYVVVLSHLGTNPVSSPFSSVDLIQNTSGIDAVIDGHSHSVIEEQIEKNLEGDAVVLTSSGSRLQNIGQLTIASDGTINSELISDYTEKDETVQLLVEKIKGDCEDVADKVACHSDAELSITDENGNKVIKKQENAMGDLCADAYRYVGNTDIAFVNAGGIKKGLPQGDITYRDLLDIYPYGNELVVIKVTGQQIADALEFACRLDEENNAFLQVSGISFTVDKGVSDIKVLEQDGGWSDLDVEQTYTLATSDYIVQGGDGFSMFSDSEIMNTGIRDYQALKKYLVEYLEGKVAEKYSDLDGRISFKEEK